MFRPNAYVFLYTVEESLPLCVSAYRVFYIYNPNCSYVSKILSDKQYTKYKTEYMSLMTPLLGPFSGH